MKKKTLRKLAVALPLSIAAVIGVACAVQDYQGGAVFQPFASDRALQSNQVLFPDDGERTEQGMGDETDDSALWEKDQEAEEASRPQQQDRADYLFQDNTPDTPSGTLAGTTTPQGTTSPGKVPGSILDIVGGDGSNADLIIGGGSQPGGTLPGGNPGTGEAPTPPDSTAPGEDTPSGPVPPTPTPTPTPPTPTPDPTPKPDQENNGGGGGSAAPTPKPNYSETAKDPETPKGEPGDSIPGDQPNPVGPNTPKPNGKTTNLFVIPSSKYPLYAGQSVSALDIYRALDTYVTDLDIGNFTVNTYYWSESDYGTLFRIDGISFDGGTNYKTDFPVTIPAGLAEGQIKVQVAYRFSTEEEWTTHIADYSVSEVRLYVLSQQLEREDQTLESANILNNDILSPKVGEKLNLFRYQRKLLSSSADKDGRLTKLFPGWEENGQLVPFLYPASSGRHVLEPADSVAYDNDLYDVWLASYYVSRTDYTDYPVLKEVDNSSQLQHYYDCQLQTLMDYGSVLSRTQLDRLTVPDYVQAVDPVCLFTSIQTNWLELPASVIYVATDNDDLVVKEGYFVAAENPCYTAQDGILFNKQKTKLLGVPFEQEELDVPETVEQVVLPKKNSVNKLVLHSTTVDSLPKINYDNLKNGSTISVPLELLNGFVAANQELLAKRDLNVTVSGGSGTNYFVQNGVVMSGDGNVEWILYHGKNALYLPKGALRLSKTAMDSHAEDVTTLVLPADGQLVDLKEALAESAVRTVYCYTAEQAASVTEQLGGTSITVSMLTYTAHGYIYYETTEGIVLVAVPPDLTTFDGTLGEAVAPVNEASALIAIADGAFAQCSQLQWVRLPESVKSIGTQAFDRCSKLEGILIDSKDTITIGKDAFENCPALRFIASNAKKAEMLNNYQPTLSETYSTGDRTINRSFLFCLDGSEGYPDNWDSFQHQESNNTFTANGCQRFDLIAIDEAGSSYALFGWNETEDDWLVLRAGKTLPDTVQLPEKAYWFYDGSFANTLSRSGNGYTVNLFTKEEPLKHYWGFGTAAFYRSDIAGSLQLSGFMSVGSYVFADSIKLEQVKLQAGIFYIGRGVFQDCTSLEDVLLGTAEEPFNSLECLMSNYMFAGCNQLSQIAFAFPTPPETEIYGIGDQYTFNSSWEEEENAKLKLIVPEKYKEAYLKAWRDAAMGTTEVENSTPYLELRKWMNKSGRLTEEELDQALVERALNAENHLRQLLGMESITMEQMDTFCNINCSLDDGILTLTSVYTQEQSVTLDPDTIGIPNSWCLDYIGANAFKHAPKLTQIIAKSDLAGIQSGAFADKEEAPITLTLKGEEPPELVLAGEPFDFTGLSSIEVPEDSRQDYLNAWAYPAAGYENYEDMYFAIFSENEEATLEEIHDKMAELLLPCEKQLRKLLGMKPTEELTVELGVEPTPSPEPGDSENTGGDGNGGDENNGETSEELPSDQTNQNQTTQDQTGEDKKPEETEGETTDRQDPPKPETAQPDQPETSQPSGPEPAETPDSTTETEEAAS